MGLGLGLRGVGLGLGCRVRVRAGVGVGVRGRVYLLGELYGLVEEARRLDELDGRPRYVEAGHELAQPWRVRLRVMTLQPYMKKLT